MCQNIDKIIYINLERRKDRKEQIEKQLDEFKLSYERFEAIDNKEQGTLGCGYSHLNVLKLAKERGYKNILILEDDFEFLVSKEDFEEQLNNFFKLGLKYDVCFLSYNLIRYEELKNNVVNKGLEVQTASGYIVNNNYYDKLINLYEEYLPLLKETKQHWIYANDQIWKQFQENDNWYYFINRLGKQSSGYSDNAGTYVDYQV
jgi:GR25 family glycosyltransferase involved in LPS biosynthesis